MTGKILLLGINHTSANVALREKVSEETLGQKIRTSYFGNNCNEFFILSTCSRTEIVFVIQKNETEKLKKLFHPLNPYVYENKKAINHFFEVACGLDSMILGESEILAQIKLAYETAKRNGTVGATLHQLLKDAIRIGKRVRHETKIGTGVTSVAHAAILLAKKESRLSSESTVLLIGAGSTGERVLKHLTYEGIKKVIITNRTFIKAQQLAVLHGGKAVAFSDLEQTLSSVDMVITATSSSKIILSAKTIKQSLSNRKNKPLYLIDLSVPRNIDTLAGEIKNVHLFTIDAIQKNGNKQF